MLVPMPHRWAYLGRKLWRWWITDIYHPRPGDFWALARWRRYPLPFTDEERSN